MRLMPTALFLVLLLLTTAPCTAKIYRYQREGVWYYTDTPPPDMPKESEEMFESGKAAQPPSPQGAPLLSGYPARNAIERAATATVAIKTAVGLGSGFFISSSGHIITNKHVVRTTEQQKQTVDDFFDRTDQKVEDIERRFDAEQKRLNDYKDRLERLKQSAEAEEDPSRRKYYNDEYRFRKKECDQWQSDLLKRKRDFKDQLRQYESGRGDYTYSRSVADLSQSFTVILVDNTELYAYLVAVSDTHDLALLKLDGYRTPALTPGDMSKLAQGDPVYAIGNPAQLRNTVTSGIFSGFEGAYIQTNAQISPGNSGGPLIDPQGNVLGVNTKKKTGKDIEGLGFAIPIETVIREFGSRLP